MMIHQGSWWDIKSVRREGREKSKWLFLLLLLLLFKDFCLLLLAAETTAAL